MSQNKHYELKLVFDGFSFPTSLTFDENGVTYVAESGLPFNGAPNDGRAWRLDPDGDRHLLINGLRQPVNGLTFFNGYLYVSGGGNHGYINRYDIYGNRDTVILDNYQVLEIIIQIWSPLDRTIRCILAKEP
jgi:hypothetical protein